MAVRRSRGLATGRRGGLLRAASLRVLASLAAVTLGPGAVRGFVAVRPEASGRGEATRRAWFGWSAAAVSDEDFAAYDVWAADYPQAAATGQYLGTPASRDDVARQAAALRATLGLSGAELLELVEADSLVLFAGPEERLREVFAQIKKEVGSEEAALDVVRMQPGALLPSAREIEGKGEGLRTFAKLSQVLRPVYKASRSLFSPLVRASSGIKPPSFAFLRDLPDVREVLVAAQPFVFGPQILVVFSLVAYASGQLYDTGEAAAPIDAALAEENARPWLPKLIGGLLGT